MNDIPEDTVVCCSCGKKLLRDNPDAEHIEYIIDRDTGNLVCIECYTFKDKQKPPEVYLFPEDVTFWVTTMFTGSEDFSVDWIDDNDYIGHWIMHSKSYIPFETDNIEATEKMFREEGKSFAIITMLDNKEIWIKE